MLVPALSPTAWASVALSCPEGLDGEVGLRGGCAARLRVGESLGWEQTARFSHREECLGRPYTLTGGDNIVSAQFATSSGRSLCFLGRQAWLWASCFARSSKTFILKSSEVNAAVFLGLGCGIVNR